jgi:hypothetical protein
VCVQDSVVLSERQQESLVVPDELSVVQHDQQP